MIPPSYIWHVVTLMRYTPSERALQGNIAIRLTQATECCMAANKSAHSSASKDHGSLHGGLELYRHCLEAKFSEMELTGHGLGKGWVRALPSYRYTAETMSTGRLQMTIAKSL